MNIREKLYLFITGGDLSEVFRRADEAVTYRRLWENETSKTGRLRADIRAIRDSLSGTQSGTARRVRRMCEEALK